MDQVDIKLKLMELIYKHGSRKDAENIYDKVDEMMVFLKEEKEAKKKPSMKTNKK